MDKVDNIKKDDFKKLTRKYKELISSIQNNSKNDKDLGKENTVKINGIGVGNFEKVEKI